MYAQAATIDATPISSTGQPPCMTIGRPTSIVAITTATSARCTAAIVSQPRAVARGRPIRLAVSAPRLV